MTTPISEGSVYGLSQYGTSTYGLALPSAYQCAPMTATPLNYGTVSVTWTKPTATFIARWRLVANRYGYPVDENDGSIVIDDLTYPGSSYLDQTVIPGTYQYYGFYVLADVDTNLWIRSGFAACLTPVNFGSSGMLLGLMPEYFRTESDGGALTDDVSGDSQLVEFLNVLGWMWDYIKTQYNVLVNHLNDPMFIPLDDLWNMSAEVGLTFSPDVPAYTVRKAVANQAHVSQNRGTIEGIVQEINIRTGWGADVQVGPNMLLVNDQAQFLNPVFETYSPAQVYRTPANCYDEWNIWHPERCCVWWPLGGVWDGFTSYFPGTGFWYQCATDQIVGIAPPSDGTSNGNWTCVGGPGGPTDDFIGTLANPVTNSTSTWEALDSTATNSIPAAQTLTQGLGVLTPGTTPGGTNYAWNALRLYNQGGSPKNLMIRSVARRTNDLFQIPDPSFEAGYTLSYVYGYNFNGYNSYYGDFGYGPYGFNYGVPWLDPTWPLIFWVNYGWAGVEEARILRPGFWAANNCLYHRTNVNAVGAYAHSGSYSVLCTPYFKTGCYFGSPWIKASAGTSITGSFYVRPLTTSTAATTVSAGSNGGVLGNVATWSSPSPGVLDVASTSAFPAGGGTFTVVGSSATETLTYTGKTSTALTGCQYVSGTSSNTVATSAEVTLIHDTIYAGIEWYDQYGYKISSSNGTAAAPAYSAWTQYTVTATAPTGTAYADLHLAWTGSPCANDAVWFDDVSLVPSATIIPVPPEIIQAVQDGIPVPWIRPSQVWDAETEYKTNDVTSYGGQPFIALTASAGATPPTTCVATANWAPLSQDPRIRVLLAAETSQDLTSGSNLTAQVIPFVEWYDQQGNYLARVFARNPNSGGGVVAHPGTMTFDSFTTPSRVVQTTGGTPIAPTAWTAAYYDNATLSGDPVVTGTVPSLDINWGGNSPVPGIATSGWSAQFTGTFIAPTSGSYSFTSTGSGGIQVFANGLEIINNWSNPVSTQVTGATTLIAGATVNVTVNYYDPPNSGGTPTTVDIPNVNLTAFYQSGSFTVPSNTPFTFSCVVETPNFFDSQPGTATVAFFNGSTVISTASATWPSGYDYEGHTLEITGTTPPGTTSAQISFSQEYYFGDVLTNIQFSYLLPVVTTSSIDVVATVPSVVSVITVTDTLTGRTTDDELCTWTAEGGTWLVGGYNDGTVWPASSSARSVAVVSGAANANVGITFRSEPAPLFSQGLVLRFSNGTNYWRSDRTTLSKKVAGIWTLIATHSTPFQDNDRMTAVLAGSGNTITIYRNNVEVSSTTDTFNSTATLHGIVSETSSVGVDSGAFTDIALVEVLAVDTGAGSDNGWANNTHNASDTAAGTDTASAYSPAIAETFTATTPWTCPAGIFAVQWEGYGAGLSGTGGSHSAAGSGGRSGAYVIVTGIPVTPGNVYSVNVDTTSFTGDDSVIHTAASGGGNAGGVGGYGTPGGQGGSASGPHGGAGGYGGVQGTATTNAANGGSGSGFGGGGGGGGWKYSTTGTTSGGAGAAGGAVLTYQESV